MANVVVVLVAVLVAWYVVSVVRRRRRGLVAERGTSVGADLGAMSDQPRVRVRAVAEAQPGRVLVVLSRHVDPHDGPMTVPDLELLVHLGTEEFGFNQLQEWERSQAVLAMVMPPGSHILRLRAIDDLQPLTLRRVDRGPL